jgi:hypothetical protein
LRDFWIPWKLFIFPIVQFGAFVFSWSASNFLVVNLTQSQVFAAPPYNFGAQSVGFTNFAVYAGALFAIATAGKFSDWVAMRQTIRNNGIREPEMRLLALVPYTVLLFLGSLIVALGYEYQWPWEVIVIIGYTFIGAQGSSLSFELLSDVLFTAIPAMAMTYAIDSYKPIAGVRSLSKFHLTKIRNFWSARRSTKMYGDTVSPSLLPPGFSRMALLLLS